MKNNCSAINKKMCEEPCKTCGKCWATKTCERCNKPNSIRSECRYDINEINDKYNKKVTREIKILGIEAAIYLILKHLHLLFLFAVLYIC